MKRAKTIEAVLCLFTIGCLIMYGMWVLRDLREIGPIEHSSGSSLLVSPIMAEVVLYGPGDWFVYYVAGKALGWAWDQLGDSRGNGPASMLGSGCPLCDGQPVGGGGGGGW